jgi:gamma-glutamyl:cysteine ligase YbdK (ATP-grasp superfamily)
MPKQAISVTLQPDNLVWLKGRARGATRSVSETLDRLIASARKGGDEGEVRSVVGTVSIAAGDPELARADEALREMMARSLGLPARHAPPRPGTRARGRRG